jgi:hypothetical protein
MDWIQVLTIIGANIVLLGGMIGVVVSLFLHSDKKMEEHRKEAQEILKGIKDDMKDFNTKMEQLRMDMYAESKDFHSRLLIIEERNRPKIL